MVVTVLAEFQDLSAFVVRGLASSGRGCPAEPRQDLLINATQILPVSGLGSMSSGGRCAADTTCGGTSSFPASVGEE